MLRRISLALALALMIPIAALAAEKWEWGTDPAVLIKQGAVRLTKQQVRSLIVGKTEAWRYDNSGKNAAYYSPNGELYIKLLGKRTIERWSVSANGTVCYSKCHYYLRYKGKIVMVWNGKTSGVKRYWAGNKL